jgi:hypothetical protein
MSNHLNIKISIKVWVGYILTMQIILGNKHTVQFGCLSILLFIIIYNSTNDYFVHISASDKKYTLIAVLISVPY